MEGLGKLVQDIGGVGITMGVLTVVGGALIIFAPELIADALENVKNVMSGWFVMP